VWTATVIGGCCDAGGGKGIRPEEREEGEESEEREEREESEEGTRRARIRKTHTTARRIIRIVERPAETHNTPGGHEGRRRAMVRVRILLSEEKT